MEIKKSELKALVHKAVEKQGKKSLLESKRAEILNKIKQINEDAATTNLASVIKNSSQTDTNPPIQPGTQTTPAAAPTIKAEKQESLFDAKPGETVILNFQDITFKVQRLHDDLFKVVDSASTKIHNGDFLILKGPGDLIPGKEFQFMVLREAPSYQSNALQTWKIIKN
jgi:hypothetical protein